MYFLYNGLTAQHFIPLLPLLHLPSPDTLQLVCHQLISRGSLSIEGRQDPRPDRSPPQGGLLGPGGAAGDLWVQNESLKFTCSWL